MGTFGKLFYFNLVLDSFEFSELVACMFSIGVFPQGNNEALNDLMCFEIMTKLFIISSSIKENDRIPRQLYTYSPACLFSATIKLYFFRFLFLFFSFFLDERQTSATSPMTALFDSCSARVLLQVRVAPGRQFSLRSFVPAYESRNSESHCFLVQLLHAQ